MQLLSQIKQSRKSQANKSEGDKNEEKIIIIKTKEVFVDDNNGMKENTRKTTSRAKSNVDLLKHSKSTEIKPNLWESTSQSFQEKKPVISQTSERTLSTERDEEMQRVYQNNYSLNNSHGKITHNVTSRFGMKTFTVVPPKPAVSYNATDVPAVTLTLGAIKIDDQGNMVRAGITNSSVSKPLAPQSDSSTESLLLGKAKDFWSSSERQETAVPHNKGLIDKDKGSVDGLKRPPFAVSKTSLETRNTEDTITSLFRPAAGGQPKEMVKKEEKEPVKDIKVVTQEQPEVESSISVSRHTQHPSNKPVHPPFILPELRKDFSFLKPSRRTSSQYVASAINKYSSNTSAKPDYIPRLSDSAVSSKTQAVSFQRSGRSVHVDPNQSSVSSMSNNKENESSFTHIRSGPTRSISCPEYVSDSQRDFVEVRTTWERFGSGLGSNKGISNTLETTTTKNKLLHSKGTTHTNMAANNDKDVIKHFQPQSPKPVTSSPLQSPAKLATSPKIMSTGLTIVSKAQSVKYCFSSEI